jgi:hypothetical protein
MIFLMPTRRLHPHVSSTLRAILEGTIPAGVTDDADDGGSTSWASSQSSRYGSPELHPPSKPTLRPQPTSSSARFSMVDPICSPIPPRKLYRWKSSHDLVTTRLGGAAVEAEPARALCTALAVAWLKFQNVKVSEAQRSVAEFFRRMAYAVRAQPRPQQEEGKSRSEVSLHHPVSPSGQRNCCPGCGELVNSNYASMLTAPGASQPTRGAASRFPRCTPGDGQE